MVRGNCDRVIAVSRLELEPGLGLARNIQWVFI